LDLLDSIYLLLHAYLLLVILYIFWIQYLKPKLNGEKTSHEILTEFIAETTLDDDCKLLSQREATLKEKLFFQKVTGAFFFIFLVISFMIFLGLLSYFSLFESLSFIFLSIIALYLKLNSDLKSTGSKSKIVKTIEGTVRKIDITGNGSITVGQTEYIVPDEFLSIPEYNEKVRLEIYDDYEIIKINDEYLFENKTISSIKNSKTYHKAISIAFLICTFISFLLLFDSTSIKVGVYNLFLDNKKQDYVNSYSFLGNTPKVGQVISLSGYRVCEGTSFYNEACGNFIMDNKALEFQKTKEIENYFNNSPKFFETKRLNPYTGRLVTSFGKKYLVLNDVNKYINLVDSLKNIKFYEKKYFNFSNAKTTISHEIDKNPVINFSNYLNSLCKKLSSCIKTNKIYIPYTSQEYRYFINLRKELENRLVHYKGVITANLIKEYISKKTNKVFIKYLDIGYMDFNKDNYATTFDYNKFYALLNDTLRIYSKEFIVYDIEKINKNNSLEITVIPYDNKNIFMEGLLILVYLFIMSLLTIIHLILGYKKRVEK